MGWHSHEESETLTEDKKMAQLTSSMLLLGCVMCVVGIVSDQCPCSHVTVAGFE